MIGFGDHLMVNAERYEQFTIYKSDVFSAFIYADFDKPDIFMEGLAEFILRETNLLNYANTLTPIEFVPSKKIYKKLYSTIGTFLNSELELLSFDDVSGDVLDVLGEEYEFISVDGKTLIQNDKIGKIGEYIFHLLLSDYYGIHCIIPKFRCVTDRNMSVFGIDALFYNPETRSIYFGESKVCKTIDNAISLINRSFSNYEQQIKEEYKLVLSNDEVFNLSQEFNDAFQEYTSVCITFEEFTKAASIRRICIPAFLAHGGEIQEGSAVTYLDKMNKKLTRNQILGLETEYLFISLPIINKAQMMDVLMRKVVQKSNEYQKALSAI